MKLVNSKFLRFPFRFYRMLKIIKQCERATALENVVFVGTESKVIAAKKCSSFIPTFKSFKQFCSKFLSGETYVMFLVAKVLIWAKA